MERVSDLSGCGQHCVEGQPPQAQQVQRHPSDPIQPRLVTTAEPPAQPGCRPALDHVKELTPSDVNDRGGPGLRPPQARPGEQHLINPERCNSTIPVDVQVQQSSAVDHHGVIDRSPASTKHASDV